MRLPPVFSSSAFRYFPLLAFVACAALAAEAPVGTAHVYKRVGDRALKLFVVSPPDAKPADRRPALVLFHGGGWTGGAPTQFNTQAAYLASRGLVCVQVEYRLLDKTNKAPPVICVQDAQSAMRWVRSHAAALGVSYGIDADPAKAEALARAEGQMPTYVIRGFYW